MKNTRKNKNLASSRLQGKYVLNNSDETEVKDRAFFKILKLVMS